MRINGQTGEKRRSLRSERLTLPPARQTSDSGDEYENRLFERQDKRVNQGVPNDFVIAVTASGKSAMSGTGKTTLATHIAKECDSSPGGFDADEKATLNIQEFARKVAEIPDKSAIIYDESQGTPGEGTGLDARRGMKDETLDAINSILANRNKNLTVVLVAQHLPLLDKRVPMLLDAWVLIRKGPDEPDGPLAVHHKVQVEDYTFGSPKIRTPGVEDLDWPSLPEDDPDYLILESLKEDAKLDGSEDEEQELDLEAQAELAYNIKLARDIPWTDVPEHSDRLTYTGDYLRKVAKDSVSE